MIQLIINGHPCHLPKDATFAVKRENPIFTNNGDSTNNVTIPQSEKLIKAIGDRRRFDHDKRGGKFDAEIKVNNRTIISGVATITGYTSDTVSFQFLGGNSSVNFLSKFESQYIDELDLGYALDDIDGKDDSYETFRQYVNAIAIYDGYTNPNDQIGTLWYRFLDHRRKQFALFPVQNDSTVFNHWEYSTYHYTDEAGQSFNSQYIMDEPVGMPNTIWAPQPHFFEITRRIIESIGYSIDYNGIAELYNKFSEILYIVNCTETQRFNEMLPHWTVTQFLTELQNITGSVIVFDTSKKICKLVKRDIFLNSSSKIFLNDVKDIFEVSVDEEETTDVSNANLFWGTDEELINSFDDKLLSQFTVKNYDTFSKLQRDLINVGDGKNRPFIAKYKGSFYIWYNNSVKEVNDMGPIFRGVNNDNVTLNICPAKIGTDIVTFRGGKDWKEQYLGSKDYYVWYRNSETITIPCPIGETAIHNQPSIEDYIDSGEEESWSLDKIYICCFKRLNTIHELQIPFGGKNIKIVIDSDARFGNRRYWFAWVNYNYLEGIPDVFECSPNLRINNIDATSGINSWGNYSFKDIPIYDTTKQVSIKFYDDIPDDFTDRIFQIRNKLYAAKEINLSFKNDSINPEKEGIFIPISEFKKGSNPTGPENEDVDNEDSKIIYFILDENNDFVETPLKASSNINYKIDVTAFIVASDGSNIHVDSCEINVSFQNKLIFSTNKESGIFVFNPSLYTINERSSINIKANMTYMGKNYTSSESIQIDPN